MDFYAPQASPQGGPNSWSEPAGDHAIVVLGNAVRSQQSLGNPICSLHRNKGLDLLIQVFKSFVEI